MWMRYNKLLVPLVFSMLFGSGAVVASPKSALPIAVFDGEIGNVVPSIESDFLEGQSAYLSGDYKTALKWYTLAAERGHVYALYNLGVMYENGESVLKNDKTAVKWYTKAAEQGGVIAQRKLGWMYNNGTGVLENDKTAVKWYTKAAKQGDGYAQWILGGMYLNGEGVLTDTKRAYMWYNIGAYNGSHQAAKNRDIIAKNMTFTQIDKAQDMSSRCFESGYTDC
jgi:TPR repeat protein